MEWELINEYGASWTRRLKVEGGYLYRICIQDDNDNLQIAMSFVPEVDLTRYQAHLRDAYKKGYEDGQSDFKNGINGYEKNIP